MSKINIKEIDKELQPFKKIVKTQKLKAQQDAIKRKHTKAELLRKEKEKLKESKQKEKDRKEKERRSKKEKLIASLSKKSNAKHEKLFPKSSICTTNLIYLDNNATTLMCEPAQKKMTEWMSCYNISSDNKYVKDAKSHIEKVKSIVHKFNNTTEETHIILFTSGGTESNCFILRATTKAYAKEKNVIPHVITSEIEHHSILECLHSMEKNGEIEVTYIKPNIYGQVSPLDVKQAIKENTAIISIMYANNETGSVNNIPAIGKIAHLNAIPFHSDCVQIYGKYKINIPKSNLDAMSMSFHKLYGPKGLGMLIINKDLVLGYGIEAEISGSQQYGLRGGTINTGAILSGGVALVDNFDRRIQKNRELIQLQKYLISKLGEKYYFGNYAEYVRDGNSAEDEKKEDLDVLAKIDKTLKEEHEKSIEKDLAETRALFSPVEKKDVEIVILGPDRDKASEYAYLHNTVLMAVAVNNGKPFCNVKFKKMLAEKGVIVSISSACLTDSDKASHVLYAIDAPDVIKRGVIRVSMSDHTNEDKIDKFIEIFNYCLTKMIPKAILEPSLKGYISPED